MADIRELRRRKVRIRRLPGSIDAWSIKSDNLIAIGTGAPVHSQVITFAHEANHILRPKVDFDNMRSVPKRAFVKGIMREETDCFTREVEVSEDMERAGIRPTKYSREWKRAWKRGGRKAIHRKVERTRVIGTRHLYPAYYAEMYDES